MYQTFKYIYLLRKHRRARERIERLYHKDLSKLDRKRDEDRYQGILGCMFYEIDMVDDQILGLRHKHLVRQARKLYLPVPNMNDERECWTQSKQLGTWTLTPTELSELARQVRQEHRERTELIFLWPSAIIGAIGGILGVISFFAG